MPELDIHSTRAQVQDFVEDSLAGHAFIKNADGSSADGAVVDRLTRSCRDCGRQAAQASARSGAETA